MNFKSLFLILFFIFFSIQTLFSQHHVGIKGGVNIPTVFFTDFAINTNFPSGIFTTAHGGLLYRFLTNEGRIGLQTELLYTQKGWQQLSLDGSATSTHTIDYMEIPLFMHLNIVNKPKFKLFANLGAYAAYAIGYNFSQSNPNSVENENRFSYSLQKDNRGDFGAHIGAGISYQLKKLILQLEGNFKIGFGNILPSTDFTSDNPAVSTNQVPAVSFSVLLPLKE